MTKTTNAGKRKLVIGITAVAVALVVCLIALVAFMAQALRTLTFEAGAANLEETYAQVASNYEEVSSSRWNYLQILADYLENSSVEQTQSEVDKLKERGYTFTDFYLVADNGAYRTLSGERGFIDLGDNLSRLIDDNENIAVDGSLPNRDQMVFYATPVERAEVDGFTYDAVAFGYDKTTIASLLSIDAYDGTSAAYVIYQNGRVAFSSGNDALNISNVYATLRTGTLETSDLATVQAQVANRETDTVRVDIGGTAYCFTFTPVHNSTFTLVSLTPARVVDSSIVGATSTLGYGLGVAAALIVASAIAAIVLWYRRSIDEVNAQLGERNQLFSTMSEDMDSIYMLIDRGSMAMRYVTPNIERMLGLRPDALYESTRALARCNVDADDSAKQRAIIAQINPGETVYRECRLRNIRSGIEAPYTVKYYRPENGDTVVCALSDGTEEARVRSAIEDSLAAAQSANEAKSNFLSNMSHDIRTPMNAIIGFTTLLQREADNPEQVRVYAGKIESSGQHLLGLINDILDISKIEAGKTTLTLEQVDMAELANGVVDIVRSQVEAKHQNLRLDFVGAGDVSVMADRVRVNQILVNILSNAVKYTPDGGSIYFACKATPRTDARIISFHYVVSDTGIGMSPEFLQNIFSPFSREDSDKVRSIQGTGLGMAITKNLVDLMGGTIEVSSVPDEGSTFEVVLEFSPVEGAAVSRTAEAGEAHSLQGLHVLAAEDNELNAEILGSLLELEGVTYDIVSDGAKAVAAFNASAPGDYDLILMDIQMPNMDGYDATRAIRAGSHPNAQSIPIVAMTANAFSEDVAHALSSGMNAHLAKPINMDVLKRTVGEVLAGGATGRSKAKAVASRDIWRD